MEPENKNDETKKNDSSGSGSGSSSNSSISNAPSKRSFYAVVKGRCLGVYESWNECAQQVNFFPQAEYKIFATRPEAEAFVTSVTGIVFQQQQKTAPQQSPSLMNQNNDHPNDNEEERNNKKKTQTRTTEDVLQKEEDGNNATTTSHECTTPAKRVKMEPRLQQLQQQPQSWRDDDNHGPLEEEDAAKMANATPSTTPSTTTSTPASSSSLASCSNNDTTISPCSCNSQNAMRSNNSSSSSRSDSLTLPSNNHNKNRKRAKRSRTLAYENDKDDNNDGNIMLDDDGDDTQQQQQQSIFASMMQNEFMKMRITELFHANLRECSAEKEQQEQQRLRQHFPPSEGDIPRLALLTKTICQVKIGWPYPTMLPPQVQMILRIIKALQASQHCVLESPTGTGKSAAILCSTLAWARNHYQSTQEKVKIIYCSRTHSQVAQMVASLEKTPYRPKVAILGSRAHLCIHEEVVDGRSESNVNQDCGNRKRATDKQRKKLYKDNFMYDNDRPPRLESDNQRTAWTNEEPTTTKEFQESSTETNQSSKKQEPTCPHFRQLTSKHTAQQVVDRFRAPLAKPLDIEDLVKFGRDPGSRTVKLGKTGLQTWGLSLQKDYMGYPQIVSVDPNGILAGYVFSEEFIFQINGRSTSTMNLQQIEGQLSISNNAIEVQVGSLNQQVDGSSLCPYYTARALEKSADIVFCPYNYVLDNSIRQSLSLNIENAVVVLDEAHNVEDILRSSGSGRWSEFELCEMIVLMQTYVQTRSNQRASEDNPCSKSAMAHYVLIFLEKIVLFLLDKKTAFENGGGATKALAEWQRFNTPSNTSIEMTYAGPTGHGRGNKMVGCKSFVEQIFGDFDCDRLVCFVNALLESDGEHEEDNDVEKPVLKSMSDLILKMTSAMEEPEHYFIQSTVKPNGSFQFAASNTGFTRFDSDRQRQRQLHPKSLPWCRGRSERSPDGNVEKCKFCFPQHALTTENGHVKHALYCNGTSPRWEAVLELNLLSPAPYMNYLAESCRSVILASGSLSPLPALCSELGLVSSDTDRTCPGPSPGALQFLSSTEGRLQTKPPPLEADHVIDLKNQLLAVAIGDFPCGEEIKVNYRTCKNEDFVIKLGGAIASVIESIPRGGVLVFFSSYPFMRRCAGVWRGSDIWERLISSKGNVVVEPTGSQIDFEDKRDEYQAAIRSTGHCILFAVFRGKMSEGISFNDDNARGVICVGIPYPSLADRAIKAKKCYNDEQRKFSGRSDLLDGNSWYAQLAYRALAQALGRCIRHAADYGTVVLMDSRYCDESPPDVDGVSNAHKQLPKWMRSHVKSLSLSNRPDRFGKTVCGGWDGLRSFMQTFFRNAPQFVAEKLTKQQESLNAAIQRANNSRKVHSVKATTGATSSPVTHEAESANIALSCHDTANNSRHPPPTSAVTQDSPAQQPPMSPEMMIIEKEVSLEEAIQMRFEQAQASGKVLELLSQDDSDNDGENDNSTVLPRPRKESDNGNDDGSVIVSPKDLNCEVFASEGATD